MIKGIYRDDNSEKDYYLDLVDVGTSVEAIVVDEDGKAEECSCLLSINKESGKVYLNTAINESLGFDLTNEGRLKLIQV